MQCDVDVVDAADANFDKPNAEGACRVDVKGLPNAGDECGLEPRVEVESEVKVDGEPRAGDDCVLVSDMADRFELLVNEVFEVSVG